MKTALAMNEIDLCKLLEVNDSATNMVHAVANLELVLKEKLEFIANNLYYPSTENSTNAEAVATATHTLNSESSNPTGDNGGTSVWWDKNPRL